MGQPTKLDLKRFVLSFAVVAAIFLSLDIYGMYLLDAWNEALPVAVQVLAITIIVGVMVYGMLTEDSEHEGQEL